MSEKKNTVLAIDDHAHIIFSYKLFLGKESEGLVDVLSTADMIDKAETLLQSAGENMPDIIVLDGNMPGKDPMDFIQFLIDEQYAGQLLLCTDDISKAKKMIDFMDANQSIIKFQYADTAYHADKNNKMK